MMTVILAIIGLLGGLSLLGVSVGFGGSAIRRTRERERAPSGEGAPASPMPGGGPEHRPPQFAASPPPARSGWPSPGDVPAYPHGGAWGGPRRTPAPRRMWIGAAVSGALGFAALTAAAVVLLGMLMTPSRQLSTPAQAGGLHRDDSPATQSLVAGQRQRLEQGGLPHPLAAVYRRSAGDTRSAVLFVGASGRLDSPERTLRSLLNSPRRPGHTAPIRHSTGRFGGTVLCHTEAVFVTPTVLSCGWADESTVGVIYSPAGDNATGMVRLLLAMRDDMEKN